MFIIGATSARIADVTFYANEATKVIRITSGEFSMQGIQFTFANGLTLSVMWGTGNYCQNRGGPASCRTSATAEVGLWDQDDTWLGDVEGWVDDATVLRLIPLVLALPAQTDTTLSALVRSL